MTSWLEWLKDEVSQIPGELAHSVQTDIERAARDAWNNIREDAANAINQVGAAMTSSAAGSVAGGNSQPVTIPLSSGQLLLVAAALAALIGYAVYSLVGKR